MILGASKGLGLEIAKTCRSRGDKTIEISGSVLTRKYSKQLTVGCDLRNVEDVLTTAEIINSLPAVGRLYWVAEELPIAAFASFADTDLLDVADNTFRGPLPILHAAWKKLLTSSTGGKFVVVTSSVLHTARPSHPISAAIEDAQISFTEGLSTENSNKRLTVCLVRRLSRAYKAAPDSSTPKKGQPSVLCRVANQIVEDVEHSTGSFLDFPLQESYRLHLLERSKQSAE